MDNYSDADGILRSWEQNPLPESQTRKFQQQFERLVILDYVIRNTGMVVALCTVVTVVLIAIVTTA